MDRERQVLRQVKKFEQNGPNKLPQISVKGDALIVLYILVWAQGSQDEASVSRDGC